MADELTFSLIGVKGLLDRLSKLQSEIQKKGARRATRKAMLPVREAAKKEAKLLDNEQTKNEIWRNVALYESPRGGKREGGIKFRVGVRGGSLSMSASKPENLSNPGGDTRYWRYIEHGAVTIDRHEWLLPALYNNIPEVTDTLIKELWSEIVKAESGG